MSFSVFTLQHSGGESFTALGLEGSIVPVDPGPDSFGPAVALSRQWAYTVGHRPSVTYGEVHATAQGTRMVVHTIEVAGQVQRVRVILLDGGAVAVTYEGEQKTRELDHDHTYVDVWLKPDGSFEDMDDVEPFDRNSTLGSIGLMDEIDAARAEHGIE